MSNFSGVNLFSILQKREREHYLYFQFSMTYSEIINQGNNNYPLTVFKTRSLSEILPLLTDQGTSALMRAGAVPTCLHRKNKNDARAGRYTSMEKGAHSKTDDKCKTSVRNRWRIP